MIPFCSHAHNIEQTQNLRVSETGIQSTVLEAKNIGLSTFTIGQITVCVAHSQGFRSSLKKYFILSRQNKENRLLNTWEGGEGGNEKQRNKQKKKKKNSYERSISKILSCQGSSRWIHVLKSTP